jgi:hypothetical protein
LDCLPSVLPKSIRYLGCNKTRLPLWYDNESIHAYHRRIMGLLGNTI